MNAEIVSVGTELLLGQILDTHAPAMAKLLAECGIGCQRRSTIGDNYERLVEALRGSLERADVVITIGGLGPTQDDLTRDAIAEALGDRLVSDAEYEAQLRAWFEERGYRWVENNARQAQRPESGQFIDNPYGTAPGLLCQKAGKVVIALPGPKGEFNPMAQGPVREFLSSIQGEWTIHSRVLRIIGLGESYVDSVLKDLMDAENPTVAPYAHTGEVHLRLTARAKDRFAAEEAIDPVEQTIRERLGTAVYARDEVTLEQAIQQMLELRGSSVSVAESMTGGQLAVRMTSAPGSSKTFYGGYVTYSVEQKAEMLGIPEALIAQFGPVSREAAEAMAVACRERRGSEWALSITGNAGPTSDVDGKPVGLCYVGCAGPFGVTVEEHKFRGLREDIQRRASQAALATLRQHLLDAGSAGLIG